MDSAWFEAMLKKHDSDRRVTAVVGHEVEPAVPKGQNFMCYLARARLTVLLGSGKRETKSVILKNELPKYENGRRITRTNLRYETLIYRDVLSQMEWIMQNFGDSNDKLWCDMIGYRPYDMIALHDLAQEGFVIADIKKGLDSRHCILALKGLGRFHAMSKILLDKGHINLIYNKPHYVFTSNIGTRNIVQGGLGTLSEAIKSSWPAEWKFLGQKVEACSKYALERIHRLGLHVEDKYRVLNHGDFWKCNIMYKYSQMDSAPVSIRFVDYQICHVQSFAWDLVHFLYSSGIPSDRRENYKEYIRAYHDSLTSTLEFYKYEGRSFTLEECHLEIDRLMFYAFFALSVWYPTNAPVSDEVFNVDQLRVEGGRVFNPENVKAQSYVKEVLEDFEYFLKNDII